MKIIYFKKWGVGLCALLISSLSYAICYPGLDCVEDVEKKPTIPTSSSGSILKRGCISGNCINGKGTYFYEDGNKYDGEWKNDKMEGRGTYTWKGGDRYTGKYRNNKREGHGIYFYENGNKYVGEWKKGKKNGLGTQINTNSTVQSGRWENGEYLASE